MYSFSSSTHVGIQSGPHGFEGFRDLSLRKVDKGVVMVAGEGPYEVAGGSASRSISLMVKNSFIGSRKASLSLPILLVEDYQYFRFGAERKDSLYSR